jgi:hypothetical protein
MQPGACEGHTGAGRCQSSAMHDGSVIVPSPARSKDHPIIPREGVRLHGQKDGLNQLPNYAGSASDLGSQYSLSFVSGLVAATLGPCP